VKPNTQYEFFKSEGDGTTINALIVDSSASVDHNKEHIKSWDEK